VGTAYVLADGGAPDDASPKVLHLEEGVGVLRVEVRFSGGAPDLVVMDQPLPRFEDSPVERSIAAAVIGLDAEALDPSLPVEVGSAGVPFLFVPVRDRLALAAARLDPLRWSERLADSPAPSVFPFCRDEGSPDRLFGRMFAPAMGISEDPATGAACGPLAAYAVRHWLASGSEQIALTIRQGVEMGRPSLIEAYVERSGERIEAVRVGGRCKAVGRGEITLPLEADGIVGSG
jgi:trans-2,3-dihydro-3-hydroxyanthranilate isomerase